MKSKPSRYLNLRNFKKALEAFDVVDVRDKEIKKKVDFLRELVNSNIRWERVRGIKIRKNEEILYDLSVPDFENYIANGIIVHNSTYRVYLRRGKKGIRVAKLIDAPALPDNECMFKITEKGIVDI